MSQRLDDVHGADSAQILARLLARYPHPEYVSPPELFVQNVDVCGTSIGLVGLSSTCGTTVVCGSAGALDELPVDRAYFEWLERLAIVDVLSRPERRLAVRDSSGRELRAEASNILFRQESSSRAWRPAKSNGVAVGRSFPEAAERARRELVERDRILRSWYGDIEPRRVDIDARVAAIPRTAYTVETYVFGNDEALDVVAGVFAFPKKVDEAPLVYGFAAGPSTKEAVDGAARECVQRLGFLWGETIPAEVPSVTPTADFHQDYYLVPENHGRLRVWLSGEHRHYRGSLKMPEAIEAPCFVDVTPATLGGRLAVAVHIDTRRVPLTFGEGHPFVRPGSAEAIAIHPIA